MIENIELITLVESIIVLFYLFWNRTIIRALPCPLFMIAAYLCFVVGWSLTVLESIWIPTLANVAEHAFYAAGSIFLAVWGYLLVRD